MRAASAPCSCCALTCRWCGSGNFRCSAIEEQWKLDRAARRAAAKKIVHDTPLDEQMQRMAIEIIKDPVPDEGESCGCRAVGLPAGAHAVQNIAVRVSFFRVVATAVSA